MLISIALQLVINLHFSSSFISDPVSIIRHLPPLVRRASTSRYRSVPNYNFRSITILSGSVGNEAVEEGGVDRAVKDRDVTDDVLRLHSNNEAEKTFRAFPFASLGLPVLKDHDDYYSGIYGQCIW